MLEWIQRQLSVKCFFQCFLKIQSNTMQLTTSYLLGLLVGTIQVKSPLCFYVIHLVQHEWWLLSSRTNSKNLRCRWMLVESAGHNLSRVEPRVWAPACGCPSLSGDSMASSHKCWQTTCFANPFTGLLLMLTLGVLGSAVLSPARTLIGFFFPLSNCSFDNLSQWFLGIFASCLFTCQIN